MRRIILAVSAAVIAVAVLLALGTRADRAHQSGAASITAPS